MKRTQSNGWMIGVLAAGMLVAWGCAPAAGPGAPASSQTGEPNVIPDPEAPHTAIPGDRQQVVGTITALEATSITVDGIAYKMIPTTLVTGTLIVGERVQLDFVITADSSRIVIETRSSEFFDDSGGSEDY
jgi:hypothetical protein